MSRNEVAALQAQIEAQTLRIDCPAGCSVQYRDPRTPVQVSRPTNGWDAAIAMTGAVAGVASAAVVPAAMGYVAVEGFRRLQNSGPVDNSIGGNVTTGNSGRIDSADDYTHAPTVVEQPAPTVVTQPPVQIVTQPPAQVIEQPPPIVVEQPAPIVVQTGGTP
jgi:hypothetical protein